MGQRPNRHLTKEGIQVDIWKDVQQQWVTTAFLLEWPKSRTLTICNADKGVEQLSLIAGGNAKCCQHFGRHFGSFSQN